MKANGNIVQNVLPVEEASIQERQVTVQVLTIGTKQVTQSLYKQLVEEPVITTEGKLRGPIWGWVNLHVDCNSKRDHFHVVWEHNGQLKRAYITAHFKETAQYQQLDIGLQNLSDIYLGLVSVANKKFNTNQDGKICLTVKGQEVYPNISSNIRQLWEIPNHLRRLQARLAETRPAYKESEEHITREIEYIPERIKSTKECIMRDVQQLTERHKRKRDAESYTSYVEVYEEMEEITEKMTKIENQWEESRQTVEKAGQLFIAVSGVWK